MSDHMGNLLTSEEAAEYLGIKTETIWQLQRAGVIPPNEVIKHGSRNLYEREFLEDVKERYYNESGLTHKDIAEIYGLSRQRVHKAFADLNVKPIGVNRKVPGVPQVYDPETVRKFARFLHWQEGNNKRTIFERSRPSES